jgi:hypothetical protein
MGVTAHPEDLRGTVSKLCPECEVRITVTRPPRPLTGTTSGRSRRTVAAELKAQVLWEMTCPTCKEWWNSMIKRCEAGLSARAASEAPENDRRRAAA